MATKDQINAAFGNIKVILVDQDEKKSDSCKGCFFSNESEDCALIEIEDGDFEDFRDYYGSYKDLQCENFKIFKRKGN